MNPEANFEEIYDTLSPKDSEDIEEYIECDEEPIISDEEEYVMEEFDKDSPEEEFEPPDDEKYEEKDWIDEE